jgi:hypothetical protein
MRAASLPAVVADGVTALTEFQAQLDHAGRLAGAARTALTDVAESGAMLGATHDLFHAMGADPAACSASAFRRAMGRFKLLQRFAELRHQARTHRHLRGPDVIAIVLTEAPRIAPGVQCSKRSLWRWWAAFRAVGPDGLPRGIVSLLDSKGRRSRAS